MKNRILLKGVFLLFCVSWIQVSWVSKVCAQNSSLYTVIQAGGMIGTQTNKDIKALNGFQFQFIFGKNIQDKFYYGFGVGNDTYRGKVDVVGSATERKIQMLPLFADLRFPISEMGMLGRLTAFGNVGYAPKLSGQYMKGGLGKVGMSYEHLLADNSHLKFSLGYGIQDFKTLSPQSSFIQQQISLQIGLIVR